MSAPTIPVVRPGASVSFLEDECVVLHPSGQVLSGLNPTGARVWALIDGQRTASDIASQIAVEWELTPEAALADVLRFLQDLEAKGLVMGRGR